jgi:alpha-mannosidase
LEDLPPIEKPIVAAGRSDGRTYVVVDVPAMGFAWIGGSGGGGRGRKKKRPPKPMAEENVLRNEFIEAWINPVTGTLRSVYDYRTRGNRFSQQLAFRGSGPPREANGVADDPEELADYSVMAADSVEVTAASTAFGEITTRGRLVSRSGQRHARFTQTYRLWRGSRVLWLSIDLQPEIEPLENPWKSYFACRFAWSDSAADLYRSMHACRRPDKSKRIETPEYIDIESGDLRTAILTGGLPYHRRVGMRMLDTLLIVKGETARNFRVGMGFDMTHPHQEALGMLVDPLMLDEPVAPPSLGNATWAFHIDAKNVIATRWEPRLVDGAPVGFRVRLRETAGRKAPTRLRSYRAVTSAQTVDFQGKSLKACPVEDDAVVVELGPFEWAEVEARW